MNFSKDLHLNSLVKVIGLLMLLHCNATIKSQSVNLSSNSLEQKLESLILSTMQDQQIPGAALIIIKDGKTMLKKGYGIQSPGVPVNPDSTIFRIGSTTKTFTTTALLQLVDEGSIQLDQDVNSYLERVQVPDNITTPVTAHHLLTHSAGFDELKGRVVFQEEEQVSLEEFLPGRLIRLREPGEVVAYSTFAIALAGYLVEKRSGQSLEQFFNKKLWTPLGMTMTSIDLPEKHRPYLSPGYELYNDSNVQQPWEWYHTFPASSINSTVVDMGKYMQMHLNQGTFKGKKILSEANALKMQTQQLSIHPKVAGFAYGFYQRDWNGLASFSHGGDMLGYSAMMTLVPEENLGIFIVHHHEGTNLRNLVINAVTSHFGKSTTVPLAEPNQMDKELSEFAGTYRWMSNCMTCPNSEEQATYNLQIDEKNNLSGFGRKFYQVEPLLFKSYDGQRTMGFKKDEHGKIKFMSLGNINAFEKLE